MKYVSFEALQTVFQFFDLINVGDTAQIKIKMGFKNLCDLDKITFKLLLRCKNVGNFSIKSQRKKT